MCSQTMLRVISKQQSLKRASDPASSCPLGVHQGCVIPGLVPRPPSEGVEDQKISLLTYPLELVHVHLQMIGFKQTKD